MLFCRFVVVREEVSPSTREETNWSDNTKEKKLGPHYVQLDLTPLCFNTIAYKYKMDELLVPSSRFRS